MPAPFQPDVFREIHESEEKLRGSKPLTTDEVTYAEPNYGTTILHYFLSVDNRRYDAKILHHLLEQPGIEQVINQGDRSGSKPLDTLMRNDILSTKQKMDAVEALVGKGASIAPGESNIFIRYADGRLEEAVALLDTLKAKAPPEDFKRLLNHVGGDANPLLMQSRVYITDLSDKDRELCGTLIDKLLQYGADPKVTRAYDEAFTVKEGYPVFALEIREDRKPIAQARAQELLDKFAPYVRQERVARDQGPRAAGL